MAINRMLFDTFIDFWTRDWWLELELLFECYEYFCYAIKMVFEPSSSFEYLQRESFDVLDRTHGRTQTKDRKSFPLFEVCNFYIWVLNYTTPIKSYKGKIEKIAVVEGVRSQLTFSFPHAHTQREKRMMMIWPYKWRLFSSANRSKHVHK